MRNLIYLLFISIFFPEYLYSIGLVPRVGMYIPELLSIGAMGIFVLLAVKGRSIYIGPVYILLFVLLVLHVLFGALVNAVETTTIFTGLRTYFKYLPFFVLPVVYEFSAKEVGRQFIWLLFFAMIQLPVAIYQRFILSANVSTGDWVSGTLGGGGLKGSGLLTVFLMCAVTVLMAFYLRKRISRKLMLASLLVLVMPTILNETKVTAILLPMAILVPALLVGHGVNEKLKRLLSMSVLAVAMFGLFAVGYNQFYGERDGQGHGIMELFTTEGRLADNLMKGERLIEQGKVGRLDALIIPLSILPDDPVELMFGLGIGNVSDSFFGDKFAGKYFEKYGGYTYGTISVILWEMGILGVFFILLFCYLVFRDAVYLKSVEGVVGDVALGWAGVVCIIALTMFYSNLPASNAISYLFWFYSGYIVSMACRAKVRVSMKNHVLP